MIRYINENKNKIDIDIHTDVETLRFPEITGFTPIEIGDNTFIRCESIRKVIIPEGVVKIGRHAFSRCTNLQEVILPHSLRTIDDCAFELCCNINSLYLPENVASVSCTAFFPNKFPHDIDVSPSNKNFCCKDGVLYTYDMSRIVFVYKYIKEFTIPSSVTHINTRAFAYCENLEYIDIPSSVTHVGEEAFDSCTSLKKVVFHSDDTQIDPGAFKSCKALEEVELPKHLRVLHSYTFSGCTNLKKMTLPECLAILDEYSLTGCKSLGTLHIPNSVSRIDPRAFWCCYGLNLIIHKHKGEIDIDDDILGCCNVSYGSAFDCDFGDMDPDDRSMFRLASMLLSQIKITDSKKRQDIIDAFKSKDWVAIDGYMSDYIHK